MLDNSDKTPISTLVDFGLTEKEAKIYVALLELEVAKISEIAKKSGVNRSSAYVILEELRKKDLVSVSTGEGGIQRYVAASPEVILQQAEDKENEQRNIKSKVEKILPKLRLLHKDTKIRPRVYVYTEKEAMDRGFNEHFNEQVKRGMKIHRVYENMSEIKKLLPHDFIKNDVSAIKKSGAALYVISPDQKDSNTVISNYKKFGSKDKFAIIPKNKFNRTNRTPLSFGIYEDKVEFFSPESILVVIDSQEIADVLKNIFDLAWEEAKRLSTKPI